ncbi:transposase [Coleofasciculus sp.]|uniref:transposase n=1 Tax=Coleofasciculus sp. TaxID=3100458 RepID=UPI003A3F8A91
MTTLYVTAQGVAVVSSGKRRWVDPHWFRGNSYFRIGWQWVKAAWVRGWQLIDDVVFIGNADPHPAKASCRQHCKRWHRLEFQLQSYDYAPA